MIFFILIQPSRQDEQFSQKIMSQLSDLIENKISTLTNIDVQQQHSNAAIMRKLTDLDEKIATMHTTISDVKVKSEMAKQQIMTMIGDFHGSHFGLMSEMRNHLESVEAKCKRRHEELMATVDEIDVKLADMHQNKTHIESKQELRYQAMSGHLAELNHEITYINVSLADDININNSSNKAIRGKLEELELKLSNHSSQLEDNLEIILSKLAPIKSKTGRTEIEVKSLGEKLDIFKNEVNGQFNELLHNTTGFIENGK